MTENTDPNKGVLNPRLLTFPQDKAGFLYKMKNEVLKSIERQTGNAEKHAALMGTLAVLYRFAKARYEMQAEVRASAVAAAAAASEPLEPEAPETPAEPDPATGGDLAKQEGQSEPTSTEGAADGTN